MNQISDSIAAVAGPKAGWLNTLLMGILHFISDFYCDVLPVVLPLLAVKFNLSYSECGALFMVFSVTTHFIQPPIGIAADTHSINYLMPLSVLLGGVLVCAVSLAPNIYLVLLIVFLSGICSSGFHPIAGGIVPNISIAHREVLSTSIFIVGGNIGFAVAPLIVAAFMEYAGFEKLILLCIPAVVLTVIAFMRRLHVKVVVKSDTHVPNLKELIKNKPFMLFLLAIGLRSWCYCSLLIYIPLLMNSEGFSSVQGASAVMVMLLGTAAGGLATGGLSSRFGLKSLIMATFALTLLAESYFLYDSSLGVASYIALFLTGCGMYGSTPVAIVWARRILSDKAAGLATSLMLGFTFGIGYIVCVISGFIGDFVGLKLGLAFTVIPAIIGAMAILAVLKEPKTKIEELS
ncbi:MAG: MFS transporter [Succinivibrio sp.]|nr:MFS transporter [Succinivibrio sp.]